MSHSSADQQRMWQLGDCAELFVKAGGADDGPYWEIHVTPNGHLMDTRIPGRGEDAPWKAGLSSHDWCYHSDTPCLYILLDLSIKNKYNKGRLNSRRARGQA